MQEMSALGVRTSYRLSSVALHVPVSLSALTHFVPQRLSSLVLDFITIKFKRIEDTFYTYSDGFCLEPLIKARSASGSKPEAALWADIFPNSCERSAFPSATWRSASTISSPLCASWGDCCGSPEVIPKYWSIISPSATVERASETCCFSRRSAPAWGGVAGVSSQLLGWCSVLSDMRLV